MKFFVWLFFLCMIVSCKENEIMEPNPLTNLPEILKERPRKWVKTSRPFNENVTRTAFQSLQIKDLIGYTFKNNVDPIEDTRNIGIRVIDPVFSKSSPGYFLAWKNLTTDSKSFSFSAFDKYTQVSDFSKTVYHGFEFKLLDFSIGHKRTYTTAFGENRVNDGKSVFGEVHVYVRDSCFRMTYSPAINKIIIKSFLDKAFEQEVHSIHPYEFYKNYGGYVASDFCSGGRAIALYSALSLNNEENATKEENLNKEIEASVSWDHNVANGHLKFGRGDKDAISVTDAFSSVKMSVRTIGGVGSGSFSIPQEVNSSSVDLSGWLSSMASKDNHVIAEFNENGLIPISDFVIEKNLKTLFNNYIDGITPTNTSVVEPCIEVVQLPESPNVAPIIATRLLTRYGEPVDLLKFGTIASLEGIKEFWKNIDELASIFQLKVKNYTSFPNKVSTYALCSPYSGIYINLLAHKNSYTKLTYKGVLFLIDEEDKVGFSIIDNNAIIEEYGLSDFVAKAQKAKITYQSMIDKGYVINAL